MSGLTLKQLLWSTDVVMANVANYEQHPISTAKSIKITKGGVTYPSLVSSGFTVPKRSPHPFLTNEHFTVAGLKLGGDSQSFPKCGTQPHSAAGSYNLIYSRTQPTGSGGVKLWISQNGTLYASDEITRELGGPSPEFDESATPFTLQKRGVKYIILHLCSGGGGGGSYYASSRGRGGGSGATLILLFKIGARTADNTPVYSQDSPLVIDIQNGGEGGKYSKNGDEGGAVTLMGAGVNIKIDPGKGGKDGGAWSPGGQGGEKPNVNNTDTLFVLASRSGSDQDRPYGGATKITTYTDPTAASVEVSTMGSFTPLGCGNGGNGGLTTKAPGSNGAPGALFIYY